MPGVSWFGIAAVVAAGLLLGTGQHRSDGARPWRVTASSFRLDLGEGRVVTSVGGAQAPLGYQTSDGTIHHLGALEHTGRAGAATRYTVATDEPNRTATVDVRRTASGVQIAYSLAPAASVAAIRYTLSAPSSAHFLGTGERPRWVDLRGKLVPLKVWNPCASSAPSTFFASTAGFGSWTSATGVGQLGFPGVSPADPNFACSFATPPCALQPVAAVQVCVKQSAVTFDVAFGSIPAVVRAHARAVGFPRKPWLPQFGLIKWRDAISKEGELLDDVRQLQSRGLPIEWELLDNPWETGAQRKCIGSLTFDPSVFPDPRKTIAAIHARGVKFMLWISPQITRGSCPAPDLPDGYLTGNDAMFVRDLTNPAELQEFTTALRRLVALGVDGFKGDRGDEVNLEPDALAGGPGEVTQNRLTRLYAEAVRDAFAPTRGQSYGTMFRTFGYGAGPLLPGVVGEDERHTYDGLAAAVRSAQTEGLTGAVVWGSDTGGYIGGELTPQLFVRWAQFSALTPIFEVGGNGANAKFWEFGASAVERFRDAATLHYELAPYLYGLAQQATRTALPVVRPLGMTWPGDERAWSHDLELTVGDALLAAPVLTSSGRTSVYLPHGTWIDFFSGARTAGARTVARMSPLATFPLYVRAGSSIPFDFRSPAVWHDPWRPNDLLRDDRQGWLVAAADGTASSAADRSTRLTASTDGHGVTRVRLLHALPQQQLLVLAPSPVCRVTLGTRTLPHAARLAPLAAGWTRDPARRDSYVVKAPAGPAPVEIALMPCRSS